LDGLVGSSSETASAFSSSPLASLDCEHMSQESLFGSQAAGFLKHGRSTEPQQQQEEDDWSMRSLKVGKTEAMLLPAAAKAAPFLLRSTPSHSIFPDGEHMLSFSSSKPTALLINNDWSLPSYNNHHQHYNHLHPSYSSASPSAAAYYFYRNAGKYFIRWTSFWWVVSLILVVIGR